MKRALAAIVLTSVLCGCDEPASVQRPFSPAPNPPLSLPSEVIEQPVPADPEIVRAMRAAFPTADSITGIFKGGVSNEAYFQPPVTRPLFLRQHGALHYLATVTEWDGAHPEGAQISAYYLRRAAGSFVLVKSFPAFAESGTFGHAIEIKPIAFRNGRAGLQNESGGTWQGCTTTKIYIYLFEPDGPVQALGEEYFYQNSIGERYDQIKGKIVVPPRGADFSIRYIGVAQSDKDRRVIDQTAVWRFEGADLVLTSGSVPDMGC